MDCPARRCCRPDTLKGHVNARNTLCSLRDGLFHRGLAIRGHRMRGIVGDRSVHVKMETCTTQFLASASELQVTMPFAHLTFVSANRRLKSL